MDNKLQQILELTGEYIAEKQSAKTWRPGKDLVQYAGDFYDSAEYVAAVETLLAGWLVLGSKGMEFERKFPVLVGKRTGLMVNSGSSANLLMLAALKLPKGTKVLVPVAGFPTTLNPILQLGMTPVFVDIEIDTLNLDMDKVEEALKADPTIRVITFAHVLGNPPDMDRLMKLVKEHDLIFLEDCCDALGSTYKGQLLGSFGTMSSCSFYPAHHMTTGEGGFVATDNRELLKVLRSLRDWGRGCYCEGKQNQLEAGICKNRFSNWLPNMPDNVFDHKYVYNTIGYNLKPIELQAALGLVQMTKLDTINSIRKANHTAMVDIFKPFEHYFHLPTATEGSDPSWFAVAFTTKNGFDRATFCQYLEAAKIQTRPYFGGNLMLQPAYSGICPTAKTDFPVATIVTTDTFFLGCSPVITSQQIDYIRQTVRNYFAI